MYWLLPPETARRIVDLEAAEAHQLRVEELAARANEGLLTPDEERDYADLGDAGDILATLQALRDFVRARAQTLFAASAFDDPPSRRRWGVQRRADSAAEG